jgi:hypothetical protein
MDSERKLLRFDREIDDYAIRLNFSAFTKLVRQAAKEWCVRPGDVEIVCWGDEYEGGLRIEATRMETDKEVAARLKAEDDRRKEFEAKAGERAANVALAFEQSAAKMSEPKRGGLCIAPIRLMRGTETILAKMPMPQTSIINMASVDSGIVQRMLLARFPGFEDWWVSRLGEDEWDLVPDPHNEDHIVLVRPDDKQRKAA